MKSTTVVVVTSYKYSAVQACRQRLLETLATRTQRTYHWRIVLKYRYLSEVTSTAVLVVHAVLLQYRNRDNQYLQKMVLSTGEACGQYKYCGTCSLLGVMAIMVPQETHLGSGSKLHDQSQHGALVYKVFVRSTKMLGSVYSARTYWYLFLVLVSTSGTCCGTTTITPGRYNNIVGTATSSW